MRASVKRPDATADTWRVYGDVLIHAWKESGDPNQYEEALNAFRSAHEAQPRFADNLHDWGDAYLSNGELDEAVKKFSSAVSVSGDRHGPSRIGWSIALYRNGDVKGARVELDRASRINGNDDNVAMHPARGPKPFNARLPQPPSAEKEYCPALQASATRSDTRLLAAAMTAGTCRQREVGRSAQKPQSG
ncbi:hypothetical protein PBS_21100 [Paraburkholderia sp. 2C]